MGFHFRKSLKILPGVRVNISKAGVTSVRVGGRSMGTTFGKRGVQTTVSLPGTGLSYRHRHEVQGDDGGRVISNSPARVEQAPELSTPTPPLSEGAKLALFGVGLFIALGAIIAFVIALSS